jgi:flavodoxin
MKAAIIFYSFSGNTKKACLFLMRKLIAKNIDTDLIELRLKDEETSFFKQGKQAFFKYTPELLNANSNLEQYDFIVFASPVWAFTFTPALRSYLHKITDLENKKIAFFLTYGSGLGKGKAKDELEIALKERNGQLLFSKDFLGTKTKDDSYLEEQFSPLFLLLNIA